MMPDHSRLVYVGIDTHQEFHMMAVIDDAGHLLGTRKITLATDTTTQALEWATTFGQIMAAGIECTSSYGASITADLRTANIIVFEVTGPNRAARRAHGKSDTLDAIQAAEAARTHTRISPPKHHSINELRAHMVFRESAKHQRTQTGNEILAMVTLTTTTRPSTMTRAYAQSLTTNPLISQAATRWLALDTEVTTRTHTITTLINTLNPHLLTQPKVGPISAAQLLIAVGNNPDRLTTEARFAALCGVSPIPTGSGKTPTHYRLNRGGDRAANQALWRIAFLRYHHDPHTQTYKQRRLNEGKTPRHIIRSLKRYIARQLFPLLTQPLDTQ